MARTYQRRPGRGDRRARDPKRQRDRQVQLPYGAKRPRSRFESARETALRAFGILLLCGLVAGVSFAAGAYLGLVKSVRQLEPPPVTESHPTYIYSAPLGEGDGSRRVIGTIFQGKNRQTIPASEMPPHLLNALVAKEDERFMQHPGVDLWGIMRALWVDIRAGRYVEGASTITQQYVRNVYLSQEQSITRKIKEALIAIQVETVKDKEEILADYLNTVYFGNNAYGVEAAAETYFNKSAEDLTVAESATLIGLLWSPSSLGEDKAAAREQRDLVLKKMFDAGYITQQDYEQALEEPMPEEWPEAPMLETGLTGPPLTREFAELVQNELIRRYGANTVLRGGLDVYTTLDLQQQMAAYEVLYGPNGYLPSPENPDAALVSIDPETGHITAMVGNRDPESQFNLVTQARRQPGSSFKPFALIAALEQGIDPDTHFISEKKVYQIPKGNGQSERWKVENYEKIERGSISLKEALWESDNTVFTDLVMNAGSKGLRNGPEAVADVARRLGVSSDFGRHPDPSIVLGAYEVSPLDMATAYATIANEGRRVEPTLIEKVVRNEGQPGEEVLFRAPEHPEGQQVIDPEIAREAIGIMMGDVMWGIAGDAALPGRPVAGKTGTSENFFDSWFIGFTPQLTTAVWMGYAEGGKTLEELLSRDGALYGTVGSPEEIWHDYMLQALDGEPVKRFEGVEEPPPPEREETPPATQTP
ncbi:penicillin-binding protein [Rubrobacter xylanophilus]|uniref:Penicillin-binding protein n=1 Tax=Rubrobacter xylanophilus TaxID=49319 RepID=A0A510HJG0_9ACTN|nr:penicillin-binding protein [Rubrobacter xylanophilus]